MGLFDSFKNVFGGKQGSEADVTVSPSQMLREAGIDPSGLNMSFGSDGSIVVSGHLADEADRQKVIDTLSTAPGINRIDDHMTVSPPESIDVSPPPSDLPEVETPADDPAPAEAAAEEAPAAEETPAGGRTYTVQSGDTLWKISEELYGNGSNYLKIFEANKGLLDHPDRIFPGQVLTIPDLE